MLGSKRKVVIKCPRCQELLQVFAHQHGKRTCGGDSCPQWEAGQHVADVACTYPLPAGSEEPLPFPYGERTPYR